MNVEITCFCVSIFQNALKHNSKFVYKIFLEKTFKQYIFKLSLIGYLIFCSHNTGTSHWLDPRLARVRKHSLGECGEDELPYGWERVTDERYGSYYVDHINRRTQYENPVLQARLRGN